MARVTNTVTTVSTTPTTLTTTTIIPFATAVDLREALSGALHVGWTCTSAPSTGKKIDIYALFSKDNVNYDSTDVTLATKLATIPVPNATTSYTTTIPLDGVTLSPQYMKIIMYTDVASNYCMCDSIYVSIRKAV